MSPQLQCLLQLLLAGTPILLHAQGCVAIRSFTSCNPNSFTNSNLVGKGWQVSTSYRYFESHRHFNGQEEQVHRNEQKTQVFNWSNQLNAAFTYNADKRQGITLVLPWTYNTRSSLYEHGGRSRQSTRSVGIGDIRVQYNRWLWHPDSAGRGNLMVSAGVKLPTGDFRAMDFFYSEGTDTVPNTGANPWGQYQPVDQSIQLGDGGLGFTLEFQAYAKLFGNLFGYLNGFYLLNPMETNGTLTNRSRVNEMVCSVPDQYMARAGLNYTVAKKQGLNLFCGGRLEGIPAKDLIGGSAGFRRPGYVISVEPGVDWMRGRHDINVNLPVALVRNRTQSMPDIERSAETGTFVRGDAAFADQVLNITWSVMFGRSKSEPTASSATP
ncbi:MAG: hypothetical protein IPF41_15435 [Flavobacteriales bacterium]|nr:hypothetical protein [Flavobacteriales bacterium]